MKLKPLTAGEVTTPGAYEWVDENGVIHVGFIKADKRGTLSGSFIAESGYIRSVSMRHADGEPTEGTYYGPLTLAAKQSDN